MPRIFQHAIAGELCPSLVTAARQTRTRDSIGTRRVARNTATEGTGERIMFADRKRLTVCTLLVAIQWTVAAMGATKPAHPASNPPARPASQAKAPPHLPRIDKTHTQ